jgi:hypothetical protein
MTMALVQGQWKLRAYAYETPTLQFNDDHLRDDIQIRLSAEEDDRYNTVRGVFVDKDRQYQPHPFAAFSASEYITRDNSETIYRDIQLPMTTDAYMAQRVAAGILEQSDLQKRVIYPANFKTLPVEIGGTVALSNTKLGMVDQPFRVTNYKLNDMAGIDLVLQEDTPSAYTDVGTAEYTVTSGGGITFKNPGVPAPSTMSLFSIPNGIQLSWANPPARLYEYTEVWRNTVDSFDNASIVNLSRIDTFVDNPPLGFPYYYWVRSRNYYGEVSSYIPTTGGLGGVIVLEDDIKLNFDPGFEQTKPGADDSTHWRNMSDNWSGDSGKITGSTSVVSDSVGTGESHVLRWQARVASESTGSTASQIANRKAVNVYRGLGVNYNMRYRVTSYTNINSMYMDMTVSGRKNLRNSSTVELASSRINITNSIDWVIWSDWLNVTSYTDIASYSFITSKIEFWIYAGTPVGTEHISVDVDWALFRYSET